MADTCPTCGLPVTVVSGDEGTSHYKPAVTDEMVDRMLLIHDEIDYAADPTANWVVEARAKMRADLEEFFRCSITPHL